MRPPDVESPPGGSRRAVDFDRRAGCRHNSLNALRLQHAAERLHALGPRPLAELIAEIIARHPEMQDRVDAYLRLSPEALHFTRADRFAPRLAAIDGGRR